MEGSSELNCHVTNYQYLLLTYILAGVAGLYTPKVEEFNVSSDTDCLWYKTLDFIYLSENYHRW